MPVDNVLVEILNNHFNGIVEEMGYVIHRAAYTVFVKETWDFDTSLITKDGAIFCHPRNIGVGNMIGIDMGPAIACIDNYEPGDVIVTNDPRTTQGLCTHMPDIMLFKPLFFEGKLLCFAWCFVHSSDVGGPGAGQHQPRRVRLLPGGRLHSADQAGQPWRAEHGAARPDPGELPHPGPELGAT